MSFLRSPAALLGIVVTIAIGLVAIALQSEDEAPDRQRSRGDTAAKDDRPDPINPVRPKTPPVPGRDRPRPPPEPRPPDNSEEIRHTAYKEAVKNKVEKPGETAFRAGLDAFMEYNRQFADAQAQKEGLTVDEVKELTAFGFMAQQSQRWEEVEELIGRTLEPAERTAGEQLMNELNSEFKKAMREAVKNGATEPERWKMIRELQKRYMEDYFELTGMNERLFDDLLAGDLRRMYAPAATPNPETIPANPESPQPPAERPKTEPQPSEEETTERPEPPSDARDDP